MKKLIFFSIFIFLCSFTGYAQGCIPVRSIYGFGQYNLTDNSFSNSAWQLNLSNRYFQSFRDFKETVDLKTPAQNKSENDTYTLDISLGIMFTKWMVC
jgi:hypothetical protein